MRIGKSGLQEHQGTWGARWYSSCPACAEAERIAAILVAHWKQRKGLESSVDSPAICAYHGGVNHGLLLGLQAAGRTEDLDEVTS
jgi:hypothetical protein